MKHYVRLTDHATEEYESARREFDRYIDSPNGVFSPLFQAIGHFEDCLSAMQRALNFADAIRRYRAVPQPITPLPVFKSTDARKRIKNLRHAIEHGDEQLIDGRISDPIVLAPTRTGLTLGGVSITFAELAGWIRNLNDYANQLVAH